MQLWWALRDMVLAKLNLIKGINDLCRNIYTFIPHHDISSRKIA